MTALPSVSVCLPAYNEESTIREVVEEAHNLLRASGLDYEILLCDDGSQDATPRIADELGREIPRLTVLHNPRNMGMRYTFELLYGKATKEFVFLNSVDRQWPTRCLFDLLPLADEHDIIVARRNEKHYGPFRRIVSGGYNALNRFLFGVRTYDAGSVKLVRREIIERFPLKSSSPFTEAERMIRAVRAGYRIAAVPVNTRPRESGVAGGAPLGMIARALLDAGRLWFEISRSSKKQRAATGESDRLER